MGEYGHGTDKPKIKLQWSGVGDGICTVERTGKEGLIRLAPENVVALHKNDKLELTQ